jgi:hypothetical protein
MTDKTATTKTGGKAKALSAAELLRGGEVEVIEIKNPPGVIYLRQPSAKMVMDFAALEKSQQTGKLFELMEQIVTDEAGDLLFSGENAGKLNDAPMGVFAAVAVRFNEMAAGLTKGLPGPLATPEGSPTGSPSN